MQNRRPLRNVAMLGLPIVLAASLGAGCGCDDDEYTVHLVCADAEGTLEPRNICVPAGKGEGQACTGEKAEAVALGQVGGCTQDGPPTEPKNKSACL